MVREQVNGFTRDVSALLGINLAGMYLHGSLAMGCFNPARSDIDLLVVTGDRINANDWRGLAEIALQYSGQPRPLEFSVVPLSALQPWQYPTPYEFHYGEDGRQEIAEALTSGAWRNEPQFRTDPDLAAHIKITHHRGICLNGQPIMDVFPPVPHVDYLDSILQDFDFARERMNANPVYAILNFCRIYAYVVENRITSKDEAGEWALERVPEYARLIYHALTVYRGETEGVTFDPDELSRFADEIAAHIDLAVS